MFNLFAGKKGGSAEHKMRRGAQVSALKNLPTRVLLADADLVITYANDASLHSLEELKEHLPFAPERVIGTRMDLFHDSPDQLRAILTNAANLPHRMEFQLGGEWLDFQITGTFDADGNYQGPLVSWNVITTQKQEMDRQAAIEAALSEVPVNILFADLNGVIAYQNKASERTMKALESLIPVRANEVVGSSMDIFHKNPTFQRTIVASASNLPHLAEIRIGPETLELHAHAVLDAQGDYAGPMVAWKIITDEKESATRDQRVNAELLACAEELRASAEEMIKNSEEGAGSSERALARSMEVTQFTSTVANSSDQMSGAIQEIANSANELTEKMASVVQGAQRTTELMQSLRTANEEISRVSETISDIADQTNLLALNATIEAASAGEAGRGFAVVASEVKDLARETVQATEQIKSQAKDVRDRSEEVASAITDITAVIETVNTLTNTLSSAVYEQSTTTKEITHAVAEAAEGAKSISAEMNSMAEASVASNHTSQGIGEAAEQLFDLAQQLKS